MLLEIAAMGAREAGAEVTMLELNDLPLPLYNQDIEDSMGEPSEVVELKKMFMAHQGLLIASPEYNGSLTAALKNLIDWISRADQHHPPLACFFGKGCWHHVSVTRENGWFARINAPSHHTARH